MSDIPVQHRPSTRSRLLHVTAVFAVTYFGIAYLLLPLMWERYAHRHPGIDAAPNITKTSDGHPGDPVNVALIGSKEGVEKILQAAGWFPADPLGLRSDIKIAADTVLKRPYQEAPVSRLYLYGRVEDLAFEQPVGNDPRQRHHVRFWKSEQLDSQGRPAWMGAVTYDKSVGFSHTTGQITHHIDGAVDLERDRLFDELEKTGQLSEDQYVDGFHDVREGHNGGGDPWHTDGRLRSGTVRDVDSL